MADSANPHVQALIGHLLTNPSLREGAAGLKNVAAADRPAALAGLINGVLGTSLSAEDAVATAKEAQARLKEIKAAPQTVADAADNIVT